MKTKALCVAVKFMHGDSGTEIMDFVSKNDCELTIINSNKDTGFCPDKIKGKIVWNLLPTTPTVKELHESVPIYKTKYINRLYPADKYNVVCLDDSSHGYATTTKLVIAVGNEITQKEIDEINRLFSQEGVR